MRRADLIVAGDLVDQTGQAQDRGLKLLLKPLGLTYKLEDEVVLITGPGRRRRAKAPYPKTYYVGDLLIKPATQSRPARILQRAYNRKSM